MINHDLPRPSSPRYLKRWIGGTLILLFLFLSLSPLGVPQTYATNFTVSTWEDLEMAFDQAADEDTVALGDDITQAAGSLSVPAGVAMTLDLNGHTLKITASSVGLLVAVGVYAGSSLTIEDSGSGGTLNATGREYGAGIGTEGAATAGEVIINGGLIIAAGGNNGAGIGGGNRGAGGAVTINNGSVRATGNNGGAGIGGGFAGSAGSITINDGDVDAASNGGGAGIGSGYGGSAGTIVINRGTVNARANYGRGAGMGGGWRGSGGTITINDGVVNATGSSEAAGIGGGYGGAGGTITINGGVVTAIGYEGAPGIGGGVGGNGGTVDIKGGTVTPSMGRSTDPSTIGHGLGGSSFGSLSNSGTIVLGSGQKLVIPSSVTVQNNGLIEGEGSISGEGAIDNTGAILTAVSGVVVNGNAYELIFDLNGAPGPSPSSLRVLAPSVQAAKHKLETPAYEGHRFDGWYTADERELTDTTLIRNVAATGTVHLYARWTPITVASIAVQPDIQVPYGTKKENLDLPESVEFTLSSGEIEETGVTWDEGDPAYEDTKPGTYTFTGKLTASVGWTNPDSKTASIKVIVAEPTVESVNALPDIQVQYGTKKENLDLPGSVEIMLSSGEIEETAVTWDEGDPAYEDTKPGTYTFTGKLTASVGWTNPDSKTASVKVTMRSAPVPNWDPRMMVFCDGNSNCSTSLDNKVKVSVPAHAAACPFWLTLERIWTNEAPLLDGAEAASIMFRLTQSIEEPLQLPMTLHIKLDTKKIGEKRRAALFAYDTLTAQWTEIPGSLEGDSLTAQTDRFAVFIVLSLAAPPPTPPLSVHDISGHWAEPEIEAAITKGVVTGYPDGSFRPNGQITRAEFTMMLIRALKPDGSEETSGTPNPTFADAADIPAWAWTAVAEAATAGLVQGFADGTFRPDEPISRAEMAVIAMRAMQLPEAAKMERDFADEEDIPEWAKGAVAAVRQAGLMQGTDGNCFVPREAVTRAEATVLLVRMMLLY